MKRKRCSLSPFEEITQDHGHISKDTIHSYYGYMQTSQQRKWNYEQSVKQMNDKSAGGREVGVAGVLPNLTASVSE